ncbi:MAG: ABC transporter substrate-binding protein [Verrucomicrobiota bacterium]
MTWPRSDRRIRKPLRIGFLPLVDCAPLVMAHELGLFETHQNPEKVLMVRRDFAEERADEHERVIAALLEACFFCDQPENRAPISETLAWARYVNAPSDCLNCGPLGPFHLGHTRIKSLLDLNIFHRHHANEPSDDKAAWIVGQLVRAGLLKDPGHVGSPAAQEVFRLDIFNRAKTCLIGEAKKITAEINTDEIPRSADTVNLAPQTQPA